MSKQDRQGARTPADLERKYNFGKTFAEILGIANDAREAVDSLESVLRDEITEQATSITRDTERIVLSASESYVKKDDFEGYKESISTNFTVTSEQILMEFNKASERIDGVDGDLQDKFTELYEYISFAGGNITLGASNSKITLTLDNERIVFQKNGEAFGYWDGDNFYTGNIIVRVSEKAQFGKYAFIPRSNGSLDFLMVGG
jgi:hypothetical protein